MPLLWAWNLDTGKLVWQKDFSEYGRGGNDCGLCLLDGKLFYSTFFGYSASQRARRGLPPENNGLTACLEPATGEVLWLTNKYFVTAKCTLSARDGRLYIGGNNQASEETKDRFVWCLNAKDGSLVWKSDPITSALNVVTVGERFIFSNALRGRGNVFDRDTGKVVGGVAALAAEKGVPVLVVAGEVFDGVDDRLPSVSLVRECGRDRAMALPRSMSWRSNPTTARGWSRNRTARTS